MTGAEWMSQKGTETWQVDSDASEKYSAGLQLFATRELYETEILSLHLMSSKELLSYEFIHIAL